LETLVHSQSSKIDEIQEDTVSKQYLDGLVNDVEDRLDVLKVNSSNTVVNNAINTINGRLNVLEDDITSNVSGVGDNIDYNIVFCKGEGDKNLKVGSSPMYNIKFNPQSGTLRVPTIVGTVSYCQNSNYANYATTAGTTNSATIADTANSCNKATSCNIADNSSNVSITSNSDNIDYNLLFSGAGQRKAVLSNGNIKINPSTGLLSVKNININGSTIGNSFRQYSPIMSSNDANGYVISSSTKLNSTGYEPYMAFDGLIDCNNYSLGFHGLIDWGYDTSEYANNTYTTNVVNYGSINGEWVQIVFNINVAMLYPISKFEIYMNSGSVGDNRLHQKVYLVGSNDGINWYMIYDSYTELNNNFITYQTIENQRFNVENLTPTNNTVYRYVRYIINKLPSRNYATLNELIFYTNYLDFNNGAVFKDIAKYNKCFIRFK
jgi:hypothetical protein